MFFRIRFFFSPEPMLKLMSTLKGNESLVYSATVLWRLNLSEISKRDQSQVPSG